MYIIWDQTLERVNRQTKNQQDQSLYFPSTFSPDVSGFVMSPLSGI